MRPLTRSPSLTSDGVDHHHRPRLDRVRHERIHRIPSARDVAREWINIWGEELKEDQSLYEYVRSIYSPAHRLGEFWATHLYGGTLDPLAGPGDVVPSAIPIITDNDDLRPALARLWSISNWQVHKETASRFGSVMGDVFLTVEDDPVRRLVRIRVIDARTMFDVEKDMLGNIRGYVIAEMRPDPRLDLLTQSGTIPVPYVMYKEVCRRQGDEVVFETFLDNIPWDWNDPDRNGRMPRGPGGTPAPLWIEDYGFVPMVHIQHKDIGLFWGLSEMFGLLPKLYELDDQASKLGDYVRKAVDSPWLFCGVNADDVTITQNNTREQPNDTQSMGRQRVPIIYTGEPNAKAQPLIAPLNLEAVLSNIQSIMRVIEQEHPELTADLALATGDASGRALRVAREKAEALVVQRRAVYDDALRRIHQMALSIGAQKGYPGYEKFSQDSYEKGELDHTIGPRPVFALNEYDRLQQEMEKAKLVETLCRAGMPIESAMIRAGFTDEDIAAMKKARDDEAEYHLRQIQLRQLQAAADGASYGVTESVHQ